MEHRTTELGPALLYHVTQRATDQEVFFRDDFDRSGFESILIKTADRYGFELIDYCLMTNHYHLLLLLRVPTLPIAMQYLAARHVEHFNRRHLRRGHLVQAPYHAEPVVTEGHYLEVRRYLAMNPVEAGICRRPEEWPWGGYGGRGRIVPPPDLRVRRMVEQAMAERRWPRAA